MKQLSTIQTRANLNTVWVKDDAHPVNNGHHAYSIMLGDDSKRVDINFQNGARNIPDSERGVLDVDLLEIVRHRLQSFQAGPYECIENARALMAVEDALLWLNKRVEDRLNREVLGTNKK